MYAMNILILVESYPPIINSAARLYHELAESLRDLGHDITVITKHPGDDDIADEGHDYFRKKSSRKIYPGVNVLRISPLSFLSKIPCGKPFRYFLSCFLYIFRGFFTLSTDVILVYSPPLYMGISGYILSKVKGTRFVFNLQDIHPKVLFDSGIVKSRIIKSILSRMEETCYRKAYSFIVYSAGNKEYLLKRGVVKGVFIIPNWGDSTALVSSHRMNSIRDEKLIGDKFVVSYAGSMQQAQGLEVVVETAEALKDYNDIIFLLAGEGSSKPVLKSLLIKRKASNVLLRSVMPQDRYIQFLRESDVCLVTLSSDIPIHTVPGKIADIMSCGKPVLFVGNQQGDAAGIIREAECGFCVDPGDIEALKRAVLRLYCEEGLRKEMGEKAKRFAEQFFSRKVCTKQYEEALMSALRGDRSLSK
jgi:glycosyltransferase involved in cell wall biosynthesis